MSEPTPQSQSITPDTPLHNQLHVATFDDKQVKPAPSPAEADAAAVQVFDARQQAPASDRAPVQGKAERPANVPAEFWDEAKGEFKFQEFFAAQNKGDTEVETPEKTEPTEPPKTVVEAAERAADALAEVGLDYNKFAESFAKNGKLTDADYAEMAVKNIPRSVVEAHIATQVSLAEREAQDLRQSVFSIVGGEQQYGQMADWMRTNMSRAELVAFNSAIDAGDIEAVKLAVSGVHAKYTSTQGQEPELVGGNRAESNDVYRSVQEMTADMRDPRYRKDPAFRADVERKINRSNIL